MSLAELPLQHPLVVGLGITAQAMCRVLVAAGRPVVVVDDHPSADARRAAELLTVQLIDAPSPAQLDELVAAATAVLPSPGVPDHHPVFEAARAHRVPVLDELDLAGALDDRPLLAITGTDGKTTVTTLVTEMLRASGVPAEAAGNTDVPLVTAVADPEPRVFVVEASSFRLAHAAAFRPTVATWLNFAPDHLDNHGSLEAYEAAKARIWADLAPGGTAVANGDDPVVMRHVVPSATTRTFSLSDPHADYRVVDGSLVGPMGELVRVDELPRRLPHDLANALAAAATAIAGGATVAGVRAVLTRFQGLPHRVQTLGVADGVVWVDDSKATVPHATVAAASGFASVVLVAGGRNKGLDLRQLADAAPHVRAVVAIGDAAPEVAAAFAGLRPVTVATSMAEAVEQARAASRPGDAVLLSPGCASFDWYRSYAERGDDFAACVRRAVPDLEAGS
ncbi:MAG: UDP-N-acetylmuramoyl-L-alanine--D-glutamate ligase [Acidimicrobiales bacterium]